VTAESSSKKGNFSSALKQTMGLAESGVNNARTDDRFLKSSLLNA
jgi:hypothetical protein